MAGSNKIMSQGTDPKVNRYAQDFYLIPMNTQSIIFTKTVLLTDTENSMAQGDNNNTEQHELPTSLLFPFRNEVP